MNFEKLVIPYRPLRTKYLRACVLRHILSCVTLHEAEAVAVRPEPNNENAGAEPQLALLDNLVASEIHRSLSLYTRSYSQSSWLQEYFADYSYIGRVLQPNGM
jgi:hypothetical protein